MVRRSGCWICAATISWSRLLPWRTVSSPSKRCVLVGTADRPIRLFRAPAPHRIGLWEAERLNFARPSVPDSGTAALDLVCEAAEIFRSMEDYARETEARAQSLCKSALERLKLAEMRTEAAERARRELITEAECKLQDASRALKQAQSRVEAAEDRLTAVEFRAEAAEAEVRETKQALTLVEEAIRRRLLRANPEADSRMSAIA